MIYYGKSPDSFENAIRMLIESSCGTTPEYLDCISGRCFAFNYRCGRHMFSSVLTDEDAVTNLNRYIHTKLCVRRVRIREITEPFVMDCSDFPILSNLEIRYYSAGNYALYVPCGDKFMVHDPRGYPEVPISKYELPLESNVIISEGSAKVSTSDKRLILTEGFLLRQSHQWDCIGAGDSIERMTLKYAVRNYLSQIAKVAVLMSETGLINEYGEREIKQLFSGILLCQADELDHLRQLDEKLWSLLEGFSNGFHL